MLSHQNGKQGSVNQGNGASVGGCKHVKSPKPDQLDCPLRIKQTLGNNSFSSYVPCCADSDRSSLTDSRRYRDSMLTESSDGQQQDRNGFCGPLSWYFFPIVISITTSVGFVFTYTVAKTNCHIERWIFPYLSYTGTENPESMIFGLILNIEGFFGLIVVFLAWRFYRHMGQRNCINSLALVLGLFSCFGVIMVGNFQVTKAKVPHYVGAGLAFIIGTGYGILTSLLSSRAFKAARPPMKYSTCVSSMRCACATLMILAITVLSGVAMYKKLSGKHKSKNLNLTEPLMLPDGSCRDLLSRIPLHVQYIDLLGSITEWVLTACLLICLSLYTYEFKAFQNVKVVLIAGSAPLKCNNYNCSRKRKDEFVTRNGDFVVAVDGTKLPLQQHDCFCMDRSNRSDREKTSEKDKSLLQRKDKSLLTTDSSYKSSALNSDNAEVMLITDSSDESHPENFTV